VETIWITPQLVTVAASAATSAAISLGRHVHEASKSERGRKHGCLRKSLVAGSVVTLSLGVSSAVAASCVERLSPWQAYAASVLVTATIDVTSVRQVRKLVLLILKAWLAVLDDSENKSTTKPSDPHSPSADS